MNLAELRGLIVSIQPEETSPLNTPEIVALMAVCAVMNGAVGVRIEGGELIAAVRRAVDVPIIGLVKRRYSGFEPYITPTAAEIEEIVAAGAEIVALDATPRARPDGRSLADAIASVRAFGRVAMADCSDAGELAFAAQQGAQIVATTLAGYTPTTAGRSLPALDLIGVARRSGAFVILEGGIGDPEQARAAFAAGADAIVVGTAISNLDALVRRFASAVPRSHE
jgi:N-acylglucosamine-6-phosphate 2-epimerase